MTKNINEHNHYQYDVVNKYDKYIKNILELNPNDKKNLINKMSEHDLKIILNFANEKYKDSLVKAIFDSKKEQISDYMIVYLLENSYDMNEMIAYFSQFIDKERLNNLIKQTKLKITPLQEVNLRKKIRELIYETTVGRI